MKLAEVFDKYLNKHVQAKPENKDINNEILDEWDFFSSVEPQVTTGGDNDKNENSEVD